jgi:Mor family transcriptional regulator
MTMSEEFIKSMEKRDAKIKKLHSEGVTYRDLADRFGLSKSHIATIIKGRRSHRTYSVK